VLDLGKQPDVATDRWRLEIKGLVEHPLTLDWAGFLALPQTRATSDIHCVTTWSRYDNDWQGVRTRDLLDAVMPRDEAAAVMADRRGQARLLGSERLSHARRSVERAAVSLNRRNRVADSFSSPAGQPIVGRRGTAGVAA
jgi:DMSO/TMAO reductase YedYZ molybdopterin-dependent catalytic subunit